MSVRRAAPGDRDALAATLAAAFAADPVFGWLLPPSTRDRDQRLLALFRGLTQSYLGKGHGYFSADGGAVALWAPPDKWQTPIRDLVLQAGPMLAALRGRTVHGLRSLTAVEGKHPKEPAHWYLGFLGTAPERQGQGLGAALLREVLDGLDAPAYLESSNPRNLSLYRRHGFEVVEEMQMPWGCPPVWRMWRPG